MNPPKNEPDSPGLWSPPREGWRFFLWWLGGLVAVKLIAEAIIHYELLVPASTLGAFVREEWHLATIGGWEGWLLFRRGWRWGVWMAAPIFLRVGGLLVGNHAGEALADASVVLLRSLVWIVPLLEAVLLVKVRLRPWVWLVAALAAEAVLYAGYLVVEMMPVQVVVYRISEWVPIVPGQLTSFAFAGLRLLAEACGAFALAFWMPPIPCNSREPAHLTSSQINERT